MNEHYLNLLLEDIFQFGSGWVLFLCRKDESNFNLLYNKSYKPSIKYLINITANAVNMGMDDRGALLKYADNMIDVIYSTISKGLKNGSIKYQNLEPFVKPMINILHKYNFGCDIGIPVIILNLYDIGNFYIKNGCDPNQTPDPPKKNFDKVKECYISAYMQHSNNVDNDVDDDVEDESHKENKVTNIMIYTIMGIIALIFIIMLIFAKYKKVI
jgi:hypothetical protein